MMYSFVLAIIISIIISNFQALQQTSIAIAQQYQLTHNKSRTLKISKNVETQIINAINMYVKHNANYVYNEIKSNSYFNIYLINLSSFLVKNLDTNLAYSAISKIRITKTTLTIYYVFNTTNDYNNYLKYTKRYTTEVELSLSNYAVNALKIEEEKDKDL